MMTTELYYLILTAALAIVLVFPYFLAYLNYWGIAGTMGNRVDLPVLPDWVQRSQAAHRNLLENLPHFALLVIVVQLLGLNDGLTATACVVFFYSRVTHGLVYTLGIPYLRSLAFTAGLMAEFALLYRLLGA